MYIKYYSSRCFPGVATKTSWGVIISEISTPSITFIVFVKSLTIPFIVMSIVLYVTGILVVDVQVGALTSTSTLIG